MELWSWLALAGVCLLGAISPGPSLLLVCQQTLDNSRYHGIAAAWGHATGIAIWALASVFGLSALLANFPFLFKFIQLLGAIFLFWLAYACFCQRQSQTSSVLQSDSGKQQTYIRPNSQLNTHQSPQTSTVISSQTTTQSSLFQALRNGFFMAFLNPKSAVFFTALFSQFVAIDSLNWLTAFILVATPWLIDGFWFTQVVFTINKLRQWLTNNTISAKLNYLMASLYCLIAFSVLLTW
ncbi:lysine transporter LysE [Saccharobesus litoralis]|uniref:Lysine transporter LysE n=1 Tax=Saccharobesus litoralis TaxID=2172099 RepID=A0A2S0VSM0_9ALTE|nr:LysE family translocator [Saccharobesus litoralis]AWB67197.1 lysine transporter LysE [Saccharobesus litoralis]